MNNMSGQIAKVAPGLTAQEEATLKRLVTQWRAHQPSNDLRSLYYLGKRSLVAAGKMGMAMPPSLGKLETILGWPAKAVSTLEHRLNPAGFVLPGEATRDEGLAEISDTNNLTEHMSMTHTAALIHGSAFVTVSAGDTSAGEPPVVISGRSAREATALYSRRSRQITAGLSVNPSEDGKPYQLVMWLPDYLLEITEQNNKTWLRRLPHRMGRVPMERMAFRPHLEQAFGTPRITDEVMGLTDSAGRTVLRMEGTAEFFSFPQRYALGVEKGDFDNSFKTYLNRFLALGADDEHGHPTLGQFQSSSPEPHIAQLRATAGLFSGATSIPLNYLGIVHDNPSSADAIRAAEADLVAVAERAHTSLGPAWARVMGMSHAVANNDATMDPRMRRLMTQWIDPSTPTKSAQAQSVMSLVSMGVLPPTSEVTYRLLGYDEPTISQLIADSRSAAGRAALAALRPTTNPEVDELTATDTG